MKKKKQNTTYNILSRFYKVFCRKDLFCHVSVKKSILYVSVFLSGATFLSLGVAIHTTNVFFQSYDEGIYQIEIPYDRALFQDIKGLTQDYPLEVMARYIAEYDPITAAYVVAIAKKESNWGKISPLDSDGTHCYNYWGFRLQSYERVTPSGYTCFASPKEAVEVVASRIHEMIYSEDRAEPEKMVAWKCGYDCSTHSTQSVHKWISDVDFYVEKVLNQKETFQ